MNSIDTTTPSFVENPSTTATTIAPAHRSSGAWLLLLAVIGIVLLGLAAVAGFLPRLAHQTELVRTTHELAVPVVSVTSPKPGTVDTTLLIPAEVKAFAEAPIFARANGYLKQRSVDIGAHVTTGQLLAEIDTPELHQEIVQATAQVAQTEAALALAKTTSDRFDRLVKDEAVSVQEASEKTADLAVKKANLEAARANLKRLEDMQSFARIVAPFAGNITARRVDVGDLISANGTGMELFRLAQLDKLRVFVRIPQSIMRGVSVGSTAEVIFADLPKKTFPAKIVRTSGSLNADSRTLLVELELDNAKGELLAGSYAQARFANTAASVPLTLPANTLIYRAEGPQVALVKGDKIELRSITMGRDHGTTFEVITGIEAEDKVVINPPDAMVTGTQVHLAEVKP